jgi:putative peptidoglycan lipid II flippase
MLVCLDKVIFQSIVKVFAATFSLTLLFFVSKSLGVKAIYIALLVGQFVVTFMSLYALRNYSFKFKFKFDFLSVLREKKFFNLFTSLIVSYLIAQFYILSERTAMVDMQDGLLSSFQYSASLVNVLVGVVAVPISTSIWHTFLQAKVTKNHKEAQALALKASYALFIIMTLICSFSFFNAREIIYLIFSRGQFDEVSLLLTTQTFKAVIFVALVIGLTNIFGRFLMSIARARDNAIIGILTAIFGMSVIFISWFYGYSNLIQWHWLVANLIALVFSLWLFIHKCHIGFSKVFHGLKSIFITIAICIISLYVRPEFYFGESKFFVFFALAINFLLFVFIVLILSVVTGHFKKIKIFLYGNL